MQEREQRPACLQLAKLVVEAAAWGTRARAARERSLAQAPMTAGLEVRRPRTVSPVQVKGKTAAKALEQLAVRRQEQALTLQKSELRKP